MVLKLLEHVVLVDGEISYYVYQYNKIKIEIGSYLGYEEFKITKYDSASFPIVSYSAGEGTVNWNKSLFIENNQLEGWEEFEKDVSRYNRMIRYVLKYKDLLLKGVIPDEEIW